MVSEDSTYHGDMIELDQFLKIKGKKEKITTSLFFKYFNANVYRLCQKMLLKEICDF